MHILLDLAKLYYFKAASYKARFKNKSNQVHILLKIVNLDKKKIQVHIISDRNLNQTKSNVLSVTL